MDRKKDEANHKTFEVLSILACFLFIVGLVIWGFDLPGPPTPEQRARQYTQILGYSLWQLHLNRTAELEQVSQRPSRGLASIKEEVGLISQDPWGYRYAYRFRNDQQLLFVWSIGPNGKNDSLQSLPVFKGDDLGYILDLKMKQ